VTDTVFEWLLSFVPLVLALPLMLFAAQGEPRSETRLVSAALLAHVVAAILMVVITREVYGYGDMLKYHRLGRMVADEVRSGVAPLTEVFALIFQRETRYSFLDGAGTATGTVHGLSALLALVFFDSLPAACIAVALASASAKIALYRTFRDRVPSSHRALLFAALVLVPSFVFWSSGVLKEGFAVAGLGWLVWALAPFARITPRVARDALRLPIAAAAASLIGLTKPYLLFPLGA
jgi:hypothetical protein